ncbi:putative abundant perithecial protein [Rosellinia necatrix]|uniref:Putative abundant perithecial protein n=1 Tax=Rosellinia necatrix TaxID=77044 RepID=A0A1W2TC91_ROSNE|nr:putative abundant perithecial protein [Rosellinia necatrix]
MAPTPPQQSADFYEQTDFQGTKAELKIGTVEHLYPKKIADVYKSINVGAAAKVNCWHHTHGGVAELEGPNPTVTALLGDLTCFSVDADTTRVIQFKFVDKTGGKPGDFSLFLNLAGIGQVIIKSGEPDFTVAGRIDPSGADVTTGVAIRVEKTHEFLGPPGSIFFKWNAQTHQVDIDSELNWPKQLAHDRQGPASFVISLISDKPSD